MKKEYWIIIIVYIGMQFSSVLGIPLLTLTGKFLGNTPANWKMVYVSYWLLISFSITTLIVLFILRKEMKSDQLDRSHTMSFQRSLLWAFIGIFLALISQSLAANIENMLGIKMGSENTKQIIKIIETFPLVIIVSSVLGPILEEIVFRKIIFGSLYKRFNFFLSALISSVIFALAHTEPEHTLLYSAMGFTFAFLYVKTKRIWVPMFAHVAMNTFVVLIQSVFKEDIEKMIQEAEKVQSFISFF
ncbi:CPBP family intramembrane glutamic endopeptidase [Neobacillus sp. D3-1R]|uniref:CPBP family intramembrane glutamic endopeptidase n=1 Tax=Neobacillus sp. D3-1R TaxID=3445778 RepID=UPI003F9F81F1